MIALMLMQNIPFLAGLCTPDTAVRGGLLAGLFLAGAAGSVVHCAPLCGAFVLGQVYQRMARLPQAQLCEWRRVGSGMLLPYHLGRLITYAALGALVASTAAVAARSAWFGHLSAALLVMAALLFLTLAARRILPAWGRGWTTCRAAGACCWATSRAPSRAAPRWGSSCLGSRWG